VEAAEGPENATLVVEVPELSGTRECPVQGRIGPGPAFGLDTEHPKLEQGEGFEASIPGPTGILTDLIVELQGPIKLPQIAETLRQDGRRTSVPLGAGLGEGKRPLSQGTNAPKRLPPKVCIQRLL
jgi:hypothetical protein